MPELVLGIGPLEAIGDGMSERCFYSLFFPLEKLRDRGEEYKLTQSHEYD